MQENEYPGQRVGAWVRRWALAIALTVCATCSRATDNRAPQVPHDIVVPQGHQVHFHGFARGFQVYTWNGTDWGNAVPDATLFDAEGNVVAKHFAGPTWQSNNGSKVVGTVVPPKVTVDTNSIPWLLLIATSKQGPGIFTNTSYIHRVNTVGGLAPSTPGGAVGQVARVPYTADYFFYRKTQ